MCVCVCMCVWYILTACSKILTLQIEHNYLVDAKCLYIHCRNADGKVLKPAPFQSSVKSGQVTRIEPNRKWFGK